MICKTCKGVEFDAKHREGDAIVHLDCRTCGWPVKVTGDEARRIIICMRGLEENNQPPVIRDEILKLIKEYTSKARRNESNYGAVSMLSILLNGEDEVTVEKLREKYKAYQTRESHNALALKPSSKAFFDKRRDKCLEALTRLAKVI